jgi:hypothetical protein
MKRKKERKWHYKKIPYNNTNETEVLNEIRKKNNEQVQEEGKTQKWWAKFTFVIKQTNKIKISRSRPKILYEKY